MIGKFHLSYVHFCESNSKIANALTQRNNLAKYRISKKTVLLLFHNYSNLQIHLWVLSGFVVTLAPTSILEKAAYGVLRYFLDGVERPVSKG